MRRISSKECFALRGKLVPAPFDEKNICTDWIGAELLRNTDGYKLFDDNLYVFFASDDLDERHDTIYMKIDGNRLIIGSLMKGIVDESFDFEELIRIVEQVLELADKDDSIVYTCLYRTRLQMNFYFLE